MYLFIYFLFVESLKSLNIAGCQKLCHMNWNSM